MEYYSLNQYLKDTFGHKVYKIALDGGFTCPNRDGKLDTRGCIFCSAGGSGDFASDRRLTITQQIEEGKKRISGKMRVQSGNTEASECPRQRSTEYRQKESDHQKTGGANYIAYFQAFTNTYAPLEKLRSLYMEAVRHPDICALSIATRPDCLPAEVISLLKEINRIKPVWVELGLQTIHPQTAVYIRRGYDLPVYEKAVKELKAAGISHVVTHVILGLPGETEKMMKETVAYVGKSGADGIKLQLLHVLKGTDLAADYEAGRFETLTEDRYVRLVPECLALLPEKMVVHRITGDGPKKILIAPLWSGDKKRVLNALTAAIRTYPKNPSE